MLKKSECILDKSASFESIKQSLLDNGVVFIPEYLSQKQVKQLKSETLNLLSIEHPLRLVDGDNRLARFKISELNLTEYSGVKEIFEDNFLSEISNDFFYPYAPDVHKIYCHHDLDKMSYNDAWHHDRGLTLKYFFYLNDVAKDNGAFSYDLGSHKSNAVKQYLWWQANMPVLNYIQESEVINPIQFEGLAGSLILFDVSGYHKAGKILPGEERMVIRFHTRSGNRIDGEPKAENPYARRNLDYRSICWTEKKDEKSHAWKVLPQDKRVKKENKKVKIEKSEQEDEKPREELSFNQKIYRKSISILKKISGINIK